MRLVCGLVVLLLLPAAAAQYPTPRCQRDCDPHALEGDGAPTMAPAWVALYAHAENPNLRAMLTVQPPGPDEPDLAYNPNRATDGPIFDSMGNAAPAEIVDGKWRTHNEPGLTRTVHVRPDAVAYIHVSADADTAGPLAGGVVHELRLESVLYLGRGSAKDVEVGRGESGPGTLVTDSGGFPVYEFRMPIKIDAAEWLGSYEGGRPLRWVVHVVGPEASLARNQIRVHTGPNFPPRLLLEVNDPLALESAQANPHDEWIYVRASVRSPFGDPDAVKENAHMFIGGPGTSEVPIFSITRGYDHGRYVKALNVTWRLMPNDLPDQVASARLEFSNAQGTYAVERTIDLVPQFESREVPSMSLPALLSALALLGIWVSRRRS